MGLGFNIKKKIISRSIDKKKRTNVFDIDYADNYELDKDAAKEMNNSHYFVGFNFENDEMFYIRLGRRGGDYPDELWMVYRDKERNVFVEEFDHISKGGKIPAKVEAAEAGKKIKFIYDGFVYPAVKGSRGYTADKKQDKLSFKMEVEFEGGTEPFEFMQHLATETTANALAAEKLSNLKQFRYLQQVHYEQAGKVNGTVEIGGKMSPIRDYQVVRDHSFGPREWDNFDRYVWTIIVLENGAVYHTSLIRYPFLKELRAGFAIENGKTVSLLSSTSMDALPVTGSTPEAFKMQTQYTDGSKRNIECRLDFVVPYYFKGDFNVNEGFSDFTVDGVRGKGIAEFAFNKDSSRWTRR